MLDQTELRTDNVEDDAEFAFLANSSELSASRWASASGVPLARRFVIKVRSA